MFTKVKNLFLRATGIQQVLWSLEAQSGLLAYIAWTNLVADEKYSDKKRLSKCGFKVYSQAEEDGIIHEIFRRIGVKGRTFIEFGVSNGRENNTVCLLRHGWKGAWVEASEEYSKEIKTTFARKIKSGDLVMSCSYVTRENADELLATLACEKEVDLLSIDVDGNDYHILNAMGSVCPRVIVLEYNAVFAPPIEWVMPYNPTHFWDGSDYYGASLKSYELMLSKKGYSLVGCTMNGNNAFFVKTALMSDRFCADTSAEYHYEPQRLWITKAFIAGHCLGIGPPTDGGQ